MSAPSLPGLCAVELPGRVEDPKEGIESIGGAAAVAHAAARLDSNLRLRLCRQYKYQAPLPMRQRRTSDVLMRAKRLSDGTWECKPVGVVESSFRAEVLADFLFVPGASLNYGESPVVGSIEQELGGERHSEAPFMPPAFFTRVDVPQAYDFEDNPFLRRQKNKDVKPVAGSGETKLSRAWIQVSMVKFRDPPPVPSAAPEGAKEQLRPDEESVMEALRSLFQERSLWLRGPLEERLRDQKKKANVTTMQKSLMCVAYLWSDGPWRGAYVRLGFDPRLDSQARTLQVIDFRDRLLRQQRAYFERVQGTLDITPTRELDCHFRTPPMNRSQLYQLCDIEDDVVQQTLSTCGQNEEVSEKLGWMPLEAMEAVRKRMQVKAELMHRTRIVAPALPAPPAVLSPPRPAPSSPALPKPAPAGTAQTQLEDARPKRKRLGRLSVLPEFESPVLDTESSDLHVRTVASANATALAVASQGTEAAECGVQIKPDRTEEGVTSLRREDGIELGHGTSMGDDMCWPFVKRSRRRVAFNEDEDL
eukprot:TRINITY_DN77595_c0_g1_i1.p1 TRINITY_DN77595_c0_g1~~TRINITY_DN77595_c0_g1_i1.p1  ORF type:complete len:533 (+),score=102.54 TRINITY_DN77595_c0_g1_i1:132-1730(+)